MVEIIIGFIISIVFIFMFYRYIKTSIILNKYKDVDLNSELSGLEVAEKILENNDLDNLYIVETKNYIEENYDVKRKVIRLLPNHFHGTSIYDCLYASLIASCAIKDKDNNKLSYIRNLLLSSVNILVYISYIIVIIAAFLRDYNFIRVGIVLLFITILFHIFTLKIEYENKEFILNEYKKLNYINKDNENIIKEIITTLTYRYIYNPITLIIMLFKTK